MGMPSVMSTRARRQPTHMLAGLGGMGTPQWQHRLQHEEEKSQSHTEPQRKPKVRAGIFLFSPQIKTLAQEPAHAPPAYMLPWLWAAGPTMYSMAPPQRPAHAARSRLGAEEAGTASGRWRKGRRVARGRPAGPPPRDGGSALLPAPEPPPQDGGSAPLPWSHWTPATRWRQRPPAPGCSPHRSRGTGPGPLTRCAL